MSKSYRIELNELDLGQLLDGLEARAEAWEKTANYHRTGISPRDFIVEECNDADEVSFPREGGQGAEKLRKESRHVHESETETSAP